MKAMRRGKVWTASVAPVASSFAGGSMASSIGRAMTVPNPFRKVRRGICQVLFITMFYGQLIDEITFQTLQTQAANSRKWRQGRISKVPPLLPEGVPSPYDEGVGRGPGSTTIELRSADFSPPRSGPAQTAGSGLKSALLSCPGRGAPNFMVTARVVLSRCALA